MERAAYGVQVVLDAITLAVPRALEAPVAVVVPAPINPLECISIHQEVCANVLLKLKKR